MKKQNLVWILGAAASVTGCLSMNSSSTLDNIADATGGSKQPYVEGYIEYAGPQAKWSGPTTFTLYVSAKDASNAKVIVTPDLFGQPPTTVKSAPLAQAGDTAKSGDRAPASAAVTPGVTGDKAREQLAFLATALTSGDSGFSGCLYPVRVRLVRADGALLDKQGCRGQSAWSRAASETVNFFVAGNFSR